MTLNSVYQKFQGEIQSIISDFQNKGTHVVFAERNTIKKITLAEGLEINIKSFKKPHIINKIAYKYFRKSKAKRSFEFANELLNRGIKTPNPIAYQENFDVLGLTNSYYISEQLPYDFTIREIVDSKDFPDSENILRQFARLCFDLHEEQIDFIDHTPGNTLIIKNEDRYDFYLVDLNRMRFKPLNYQERLQNMCKTIHHPDQIEIFSKEYAKCLQVDYKKLNQDFSGYIEQFHTKYDLKQERKKKLKSIFNLNS